LGINKKGEVILPHFFNKEIYMPKKKVEKIEDDIKLDEPSVEELEVPTEILCTISPESLAVKENRAYTVTIQKIDYIFEPPDYTAILPYDIAIAYDNARHPIKIK